MTEESLVPNTCYICLEECQSLSPCECQAPVHKKCIYAYRLKSAKTHCTICQSPLQLTRWQKCTEMSCKIVIYAITLILGLLCGLLYYVACGFIGIYTWTALGICDCVVHCSSFVDTLWTSEFVWSSFGAMSIIFIWLWWIKVWIRNYMTR